MAAGLQFSLAALTNGEVYGFGLNSQGNLGTTPSGSSFVLCQDSKVGQGSRSWSRLSFKARVGYSCRVFRTE